MNTHTTCPLLGTILGGVITASTGLLLARWRWRRDGIDRYLASIAELEAEVVGVRQEWHTFHAASLRQVRAAIYGVQPFVSKRTFAGLQQIREEYSKIDKNQLDTLATTIEHHYPTSTQPSLPADKLLLHYYQRLRDAV